MAVSWAGSGGRGERLGKRNLEEPLEGGMQRRFRRRQQRGEGGRGAGAGRLGCRGRRLGARKSEGTGGMETGRLHSYQAHGQPVLSPGRPCALPCPRFPFPRSLCRTPCKLTLQLTMHNTMHLPCFRPAVPVGRAPGRHRGPGGPDQHNAGRRRSHCGHSAGGCCGQAGGGGVRHI